MDVLTLDPESRVRAVSQVLEFFELSASTLLGQRRAPSVHSEGAVPDNPYGTSVTASGLRARTVSEVETVHFNKPLTNDFLLMVKHNAAFAALLPELSSQVEVFALMRNPLAVLCSWQTVPIPPQQGHALAAEHLDGALRQRLAAEPDVLARQLILLDWFFSQFLGHVDVDHQVRYEEIVASDGASFRAALSLPQPETSNVISGRNANSAYRGVDVEHLAERLLHEDGAWLKVYEPSAIEALAERMKEGV